MGANLTYYIEIVAPPYPFKGLDYHVHSVKEGEELNEDCLSPNMMRLFVVKGATSKREAIARALFDIGTS